MAVKINEVSILKQFELSLIFDLNKRADRPLTIDLTSRYIKLLCLKKELHCKYASFDNSRYDFYFTNELLDELNEMAKRVMNKESFLITLFCDGSEVPCVLNYLEFSELVLKAKKADYFNLGIKIRAKTFVVGVVLNDTHERFEVKVSKRKSMNKLLH